MHGIVPIFDLHNHQSSGLVNSLLTMRKLVLVLTSTVLLAACKTPEEVVTKVPTVVEEPPVNLANVMGNWARVASPTIEADRYMSADGLTFSGSGGGLVFYAVDRNTNRAVQKIFYPGFDDWQPRFYERDLPREAPMRFDLFRASFNTPANRSVAMVGGGYYKQPNGERFFLKTFYIENIDGYTWEPPYPGADVPASSFGVSPYGYILENKVNGKLWRFDTNAIRWEAVSNAPVAKDARFVAFDAGERAFVIAESSNWNDPLGSLYEFMPTKNEWQPRKPFPGDNRRRGLAFVHNNRLYYGAGQSAPGQKPLRDLWSYDPATDNWQKVADYPGAGTISLVGVSIGGSVYIGFGQQALTNANKGETITDVNDFWRLRP